MVITQYKWWMSAMLAFGITATMPDRAAAGAVPPDVPAVTLPLVESPPVIDGVLDDAAWSNAARADGFFRLKSDERTDIARALMARDRQWLYFGFEFDNPSLAQVEFAATRRGDGVQRDECVEVYLDPGTDGKFYYQFFLTANNVQQEFGGRDTAWFVPWRSATWKTNDRWTAEAAIPLSVCAGYGDPAKARVNFVYYRTNVGLDPYGARMGQDRAHYIWSPIVHSVHEPERFGWLRGLDAAPLEAAFLPALDQVWVETFKISGAGCHYTVSGLARNYSSVTGAVDLVVEENMDAGKINRTTETLTLAAHGQTPFALKITTADFTTRTVRAYLRDRVSGETLADAGVLDTAALTLMAGVTANRNYYTSEPEALVRCRLGLPAAELTGMRLMVRDAQGQIIAEHGSPGARTDVKFPLTGVADGEHQFSLALEDGQGNLISREFFGFNKLAPRPGHEVKVDKFNHSLVKDDAHVFPFGIYMHHVTDLHEEIFKLMADAGFNLMFRTINGHTMRESRAAAYMELAQKHGLMVAEWYGLSAGGLDSKMFASASAMDGKSLAEKTALGGAHYDKMRVGLDREMKILEQYPNFLMHKNFDEPNLGGTEMRYMVAEHFHQHAVASDPYHPVYMLYARYFTDNPLAFKVQDVVCFDIYSYPGWGDWSFDPVKQMAKYTAELRDAAHKHNKAMMIAPAVQAMNPTRTPLPLSPRDQRAQTYTAIIYGAKGIVYFSWGNIYAREMWDTLSDLAREARTLAPALLAPEPEQELAYNPGRFDAAMLQFPMVHARLFRHPDGGYVLLAASGEESPVRTEFVLTGLHDNARIARMFGAKPALAVHDHRFADEIEPYGTRAYRIESNDLDEPIQLTLNMQADTSRREPRPLLRPLIAGIEKQKNYMPNPVFAKRTVYEQFPDFMRPACPNLPNLGTPESGWFMDPDNAWQGHPSLCMRWTEPFAKIRHVPTTGNPWNLITSEYGVANSSSLAFCGVNVVYYPPPASGPARQVFSFYAKGGKAGDKVSVHAYNFGAGKTFELTGNWERYELCGTAKPESGWLPGRELLIRVMPGATVWINGMQMEAGDTPTEFKANNN